MTTAADLAARPPRTLLFVPADRAAELLPKALASGADAIVLDLEDAVHAAARDAARAGLAAAVAAARPDRPLFVRVTAVGDAGFADDVAAAAALPGAGVVLPKCGGPDDVAALARAWAAATARPLAAVPIVETARGVLAAAAIAAADPGVLGLAFGAEDLAADAGMTRTRSGREVLTARSLVVLAAASTGRWALDSPSLELRRPEAARREAAVAAGLGFAGKLVVHPAQVAPVHTAFRPSPAAVADAERVVAAADALAADGRGVGVVDARMIDRPIVDAARRVLDRAQRDREEGHQP